MQQKNIKKIESYLQIILFGLSIATIILTIMGNIIILFCIKNLNLDLTFDEFSNGSLLFIPILFSLFYIFIVAFLAFAPVYTIALLSELVLKILNHLKIGGCVNYFSFILLKKSEVFNKEPGALDYFFLYFIYIIIFLLSLFCSFLYVYLFPKELYGFIVNFIIFLFIITLAWQFCTSEKDRSIKVFFIFAFIIIHIYLTTFLSDNKSIIGMSSDSTIDFFSKVKNKNIYVEKDYLNIMLINNDLRNLDKIKLNNKDYFNITKKINRALRFNNVYVIFYEEKNITIPKERILIK